MKQKLFKYNGWSNLIPPKKTKTFK